MGRAPGGRRRPAALHSWNVRGDELAGAVVGACEHDLADRLEGRRGRIVFRMAQPAARQGAARARRSPEPSVAQTLGTMRSRTLSGVAQLAARRTVNP